MTGPSPTPRRLSAAAALVFAAASLAWCATDVPEPHDDDACLAALGEPDAEDAFDWLKRPFPGQKRVVGRSTEDGLAFAHELEARGAKSVRVVRPRAAKGAEPVQTADGLVVELPGDARQRFSLFKLAQAPTRDAGFLAKADTGQRYLFIPAKP